MTRTKIDWCDWTWNPVWGCRNGCEWCYARKIAKRFGLQVAGRDDFVPTWIERNFLRPMPRKPSRIFINSMSDVADWQPEWFWRVIDRVREHPEHLFLFLSKRPWLIEWVSMSNAMLGYSMTRPADSDRLQGHGWHGVSFLSIEPILEPVRWPSRLPRWVIVGAETGNRSDRVVPELAWLQGIYRFCRRYEIPLFFKASLRHLWPAEAEFPQEYPADFPHSPQAVCVDRR